MQKRSNPLNKQAISLLVCIIAAFALWIYVAYVENPDMTRTVRNVPVQITDTAMAKLNEKGLSVKNDVSDMTIDLRIRTKRSNFRYLSSETIRAEADVSTLSHIGVNDLTVSVVFPSSATGVNIVGTDDTIVQFELEEYISEPKLAVPDVSKYPEGEYDVYSSSIDDLLITVSGGESVISRIAKVTTTPVDLSGYTDDVTMSLPFRAVDADGNTVDNVTLSIEEADVTFVIHRTTAFPITIPLWGDDPKLSFTTEPTSIIVTGPAKDITAWVDEGKTVTTQPVNEYNFNGGDEAEVTVVTLPPNCSLKDKTSDKVKLIFTEEEN